MARSHQQCPYCAAPISKRVSEVARWALRGAALMGGSALLGCAYGLPILECNLPDGGTALSRGTCPTNDAGNPDGGK